MDNSAAFDDDLLEDAVETVMSTGIASASGLQRRLRVGFFEGITTDRHDGIDGHRRSGRRI